MWGIDGLVACLRESFWSCASVFTPGLLFTSTSQLTLGVVLLEIGSAAIHYAGDATWLCFGWITNNDQSLLDMQQTTATNINVM